MVIDAHEIVTKFSAEAEKTVDLMIGSSSQYRIVESDPWGEDSLTAVAEEFLESGSFSMEMLSIFIGEGLRRKFGGTWSLRVGEVNHNLQIPLQLYVDLGKAGGGYPQGMVQLFYESGTPSLLVDLFYGSAAPH